MIGPSDRGSPRQSGLAGSAFAASGRPRTTMSPGTRPAEVSSALGIERRTVGKELFVAAEPLILIVGKRLEIDVERGAERRSDEVLAGRDVRLGCRSADGYLRSEAPRFHAFPGGGGVGLAGFGLHAPHARPQLSPLCSGGLRGCVKRFWSRIGDEVRWRDLCAGLVLSAGSQARMRKARWLGQPALISVLARVRSASGLAARSFASVSLNPSA